MADVQYFSEEGLENLKKELNDLKTNGRKEIARAIQEAREKGDLSENAEYDAAKDAQGMLEMKINQLETILSNARILDKSKFDTSKVTIMSKVKLKNLNNKQTLIFTLVSEREADLKNGKLSVSSPIGKGLLGKAVGDVAEIQVPSGLMKLEVLSITI